MATKRWEYGYNKDALYLLLMDSSDGWSMVSIYDKDAISDAIADTVFGQNYIIAKPVKVNTVIEE